MGPTFLLLAGALMAPATRDAGALKKLLRGVDELAAPGAPGDVCAFGERAFVVVCGENGAPVIAAAEAGKGRVLVLGHSGYLGAEAFEVGDTGDFVKNALSWLSGGKRKPNVACGGNAALSAALDGLGMRAQTDAPLKDVDCVALVPGALSEERIEELARFVEEGGGLLAAATGWGWQQLSPKLRLERDFSGNRLVARFGVAFGHATVSKTSELGFHADAAPPELAHAGRAFAALREGGLVGDELAAAGATVARALACVPDHEPSWVVPARHALEAAAPAGQLVELRADYERRTWRPLGERWGPWHVVGPLRAGRTIASEAAPEKLLAALRRGRAPKLDATYKGKLGRVGWARAAIDGDGGDLDVGEIRFTKILDIAGEDDADGSEDAVAYLYRTLESDSERVLALRIGADDGLRVWCNGELVAERSEAVALADDEGIALPVRAGLNHLLVKVANEDGVWSFHMQRAAEAAAGFSVLAVNDAIDRGVAALRSRQLIDGSWGAFRNYEVGYTAYAMYALLKSGVGRDDPAVQRALAYVRAGEASFTYALACKILALCAYEAEGPSSAELRGAAAELIDWQEPTGLYAYPVYPGGGVHAPDLSNTLYAALALRAAAARGLSVPKAVWKGLVAGTLACWELAEEPRGKRVQPRAAGFSYRPGGAPSGSMTTAGLSVLAIAREQLGSAFERQQELELEAALASGQAWLERYLAWDENPHGARWHFFFLYGLERLGGLLGLERLGGARWFEEGARYLATAQDDDGSWQGEDTDHNAAQDTVLALLFLSRATSPRSGASREPASSASTTTGEIRLRATGRSPLDVWITGLSDAARERLGEGRIERVTYVLRRDGVEHVAAEVERREEARVQRFEARLELPTAGAFDLIARASALGASAQAVELESEALRVESAASLRPEALLYALDRRDNVLLRPRVEVTASSSATHRLPAHAADGQHATYWVCDSADAAPSLQVQLPTPVEVQRLLLSHAFASAFERSKPQVARVAVILDGDSYELELDPDPMYKAELTLDRARRVSKIELRILETRNGSLGSASVGFSEVEMLPKGR